MANTVRFVIETDSAGGVTGVMRYRDALTSLGPASNTASEQTTSAFDRIEATLNKAKSAVIGFVAAFAFREIIQGMQTIISAGIDFEASFSDIRKVVDGTAGDFDALRESMRELAKEIPVPVDKLNEIAGIGGQLGIPTSQLAKFTETMAKFATVTTMSAEDASIAFSQFRNIMGTSVADTDKFASVIFDLGRKTNATEKDILTFSLNIAGAARNAGMTSDQIAAMATSLASVGLHAEKAGSAMSRVIIDMSKAVTAGTDKLKLFAKVAEMPAAAFQKLFQENASQAIFKFLTGLDDLRKSGQNILPVLDELGLKNIRIEDVVQRASLAVSHYGENLQIAAAESQKAGDALDNGFAKRMEAPDKQLELLGARLHDVYISLSDEFIPEVLMAAKAGVDFAEGLRNHATLVKSVAEALATLALAYAGLKLAEVAKGFGLVKDAMFAIEAVSAGAATKVEALGFAMQGLAVVGRVAGWVGALAAVYTWLNDEVETSRSNAEAARITEEAANVTRQKSIQILREHGINIVTEGRAIESIDQSIKVLMPELKAKLDAEKASEEQTKRNTIALEAHNKVIDGMVKNIIKDKDETNNLNEAMLKALGKGASLADVAEAYGKKIQEAAIKTMGNTDQVSKNIQQMDAWIRMAKQGDDEAKSDVESMDAINKSALKQEMAFLAMNQAWANYQEMLQSTGKDMQEANRQLMEFNDTMKRTAAMRAGSSNVLSGQIFSTEMSNAQLAIIPQIPVINPNDVGKAPSGAPVAPYEQIQAEGQKVMTSLRESAGHIFDDMLQNGSNVFKSFATFGLGIIHSLARTMFQEFVTGLFKPMQDKFGEWGISIKQHIGEAVDWIKKELAKISTKFGSNALPGFLGIVSGGAGLGGALGGGSGALIGAGVAAAGTIATGMIATSVMGAQTGILGLGAAMGPLGLAAAGAAVGVGLLIHFLGKAHEEANKFVQGIQNPMTQAVDDLFKSLTEAKDAGTLTVDQVGKARKSLDDMWTNFQTEAAKHGIVGQQALATMGPFMDLWNSWLDSFGEAAAAIERAAKIKDITDKVTKAADGWDIMDAAITQLQDSGVSTAAIVKFLGGDIATLAENMTALGIAIPPAMQSILDAAKAADDMAKAVSRQAEVETELADVHNQLVDALTQKMDYLDSEIQKATDDITTWKKRISDINTQIDDQNDKLHDSKYWHKIYNDLIKDEADALQNAIDKRKSAQQRISDLEDQITKDQLDTNLQRAQDSKDQHQIDVAQAAIDAFDRAQKSKEMAARVEELAQLKADLPGLLDDEAAAQSAFAVAAAKATKEVEKQKTAMQQNIDDLVAERSGLEANIAERETYIASLETERKMTVTMMDTLGVKRKTELEKMNDTIDALITRGQKLEDERDALSHITGILPDTVDWFHKLGQAMIDFGNNAGAAIGQVSLANMPQAGGSTFTNPYATPKANTPATSTGITGLPAGGSTIGITGSNNPYSVNDNQGDIFMRMRSAALGAPDTGPNAGLWLLHPHERVLTKQQNADYSSGGGSTVIVNLNTTVNANGGEEVVNQIVRALETNKGRLRDKVRSIIVQPKQTLVQR